MRGWRTPRKKRKEDFEERIAKKVDKKKEKARFREKRADAEGEGCQKRVKMRSDEVLLASGQVSGGSQEEGVRRKRGADAGNEAEGG